MDWKLTPISLPLAGCEVGALAGAGASCFWQAAVNRSRQRQEKNQVEVFVRMGFGSYMILPLFCEGERRATLSILAVSRQSTAGLLANGYFRKQSQQC